MKTDGIIEAVPACRLEIGRFLFWAGWKVFGLEWVGAGMRPSVKQDRQILF